MPDEDINEPVAPGQPGTDYINAHGEEHSRLAGLIRNDITRVKHLLVWLVAIVFVSMAIITTNVVVTRNNQKNIRTLSASNNKFLANFSEYMHCLVVVDQPLYQELGKDAYFAHCDALLFKGTGIKPPIRPPSPTTSTTSPQTG